MKRLLNAVAICAALLTTQANAQSPFIADESRLSAKQLLGKRLFEDVTLSEPAGMSCASCHQATQAFSGNNQSPIAAVAQGSRPNQFGTRNTPALPYAFLTPPMHLLADEGNYKVIGGQFWDGRANTLQQQAQGPFLNPTEMNNPSPNAVVQKVQNTPYAPFFAQVYGDKGLTFNNITDALAAYEKSDVFARFSSKFDQVLQGKAQFTEAEARGFALFKDPQKGNCLACHVGNTKSQRPQDWLFTDYSYDALGLPRNTLIPNQTTDLGLCAHPDIKKVVGKKIAVASLCGAFKVPTLRNIALTAPYGHNGVFNTLHDVVKFYATRDTNPTQWYNNGRFNDLPRKYWGNINTDEAPYDRKIGQQPRLNDAEVDDIVSFLHTLTDQ